MLTEIEWWGGLLFIWLAALYYMLHKKGGWESKLNLIATNLTYISTATVLGLYFYTLDTPTIQYVYVGALGLGITLFTLMYLMYLFNEKDTTDSETPDKEETGEAEEDSKVLLIVANALLHGPIVIAFGLGIYKAREFTEILPLLN
jgi:hypothetical protein